MLGWGLLETEPCDISYALSSLSSCNLGPSFSVLRKLVPGIEFVSVRSSSSSGARSDAEYLLQYALQFTSSYSYSCSDAKYLLQCALELASSYSCSCFGAEYLLQYALQVTAYAPLSHRYGV
jgi:hypothetical protein